MFLLIRIHQSSCLSCLDTPFSIWSMAYVQRQVSFHSFPPLFPFSFLLLLFLSLLFLLPLLLFFFCMCSYLMISRYGIVYFTELFTTIWECSHKFMLGCEHSFSDAFLKWIQLSRSTQGGKHWPIWFLTILPHSRISFPTQLVKQFPAETKVRQPLVKWAPLGGELQCLSMITLRLYKCLINECHYLSYQDNL